MPSVTNDGRKGGRKWIEVAVATRGEGGRWRSKLRPGCRERGRQETLAGRKRSPGLREMEGFYRWEEGGGVVQAGHGGVSRGAGPVGVRAVQRGCAGWADSPVPLSDGDAFRETRCRAISSSRERQGYLSSRSGIEELKPSS